MPDPDQPFDRSRQMHPSIWGQQQNLNKHPQERKKPPKWLKYTHWPNPFSNAIKKIDVLACENNWQALVEMWGIGIGAFFWRNLIPSPVEITRKVTMGGYKCGFYFPIEVKSPLDIIWQDGRTSQVLLEISRPATTALFYFWAASTVYDALHTFDTIMLAGEFCDLVGNECLLRNGDLPLPAFLADWEGWAALYEVIYDPKDRYGESGYYIGVSDLGYATVAAFGYFEAGPHICDNVRVSITKSGEEVESVYIGHVGAQEVVKFSLVWSGSLTGSEFFGVFSAGTKTTGGVFLSNMHVDRFTVKGSDEPPPDFSHSTPFPYKGPFMETCWQRYYNNEF